jgi:two-component system, NtrC family, response regulator AtoC
MTSIDQTASRLAGFGRAWGSGTAYLLVVDNDTSSIFHLPHSGAVVIGRAPDVDLRVNHASVSRRHATLRVDNGVVRIADLASHNGTRVNGEAVGEARVLASGDVATVGDVVLVLNFSTPATPARAALGEAGWRRRLVEELERAITFKRTLAVVAVLGAMPVALADSLRLIDVAGTGDDGGVLLLLPEVDREGAREIVERALAAVPGARAGLAVCPTDAVDADTILLEARTAARRARPGTVAEPSDAATTIELGSRNVLVADPAMLRVFALLEKLAASQLPVLINGENGSGKDNAAYAVHHWSKRSGPFVPVNCAALGPESLVDSELFGHEKGAFTGAAVTKAGLFESAGGGTVFLDEVAELPLAVQAKLLRTLENKTITRVGDTRERPLDIRLVTATNKNLDDEVAAGRFRQDLLYRISGARVMLPPLRDRKIEIPVLARAFLEAACKQLGRATKAIAPGTMQVLLTHTWPGNIRELRNALEYAAVAAPDDTIEPYDLPPHLGGAGEAPAAAVAAPAAREVKGVFRPISEELDELERRRMAEALEAAGGVKTRAAQLISMPIRTFTLKAKQYKL